MSALYQMRVPRRCRQRTWRDVYRQGRCRRYRHIRRPLQRDLHSVGNHHRRYRDLDVIGRRARDGQDLPAGGTVPIAFSLPAGFDDGQYHHVIAAGRRVGVSFNKIGNVP